MISTRRYKSHFPLVSPHFINYSSRIRIYQHNTEKERESIQKKTADCIHRSPLYQQQHNTIYFLNTLTLSWKWKLFRMNNKIIKFPTLSNEIFCSPNKFKLGSAVELAWVVWLTLSIVLKSLWLQQNNNNNIRYKSVSWLSILFIRQYTTSPLELNLAIKQNNSSRKIKFCFFLSGEL